MLGEGVCDGKGWGGQGRGGGVWCEGHGCVEGGWVGEGRGEL